MAIPVSPTGVDATTVLGSTCADGRHAKSASLAVESAVRTAARFAAIYDAVPIGIVELGLDHKVLRCNTAFATMVGSSADMIVGVAGWELFHADSSAPDLSAVADLQSGDRSSYSAERLLRGPGGSALPVRLDWAVIHDATGQVEELVCAVTEIDDQTRTAAARQQASERQRVLWQMAPIGIIESTPDGVITSANLALGAMLGYRLRDLIGRHAGELADPDDTTDINAGVQALRQGQGYSAERRYLSADGKSVPVHVSTAVLRDEAGAVSRLSAFVVDMSEADAQRAAMDAAAAEIAHARDQLADRQLFTDALLETIEVGIVSCDAHGNGILSNGAGRRLLGLSDEHASSSPEVAAALSDVLDATGHRLGTDQHPLARTLRGDSVTDTNFMVGPRGGPYRDVVIRGSQITKPNGAVLGAVVAATDVTTERTALRELAAERDRLSEAQRVGHLGSFTYDAVSGAFVFSAEILRIWGLAPNADLAAVRAKMIHPDDLSRVIAGWNAALAAGGAHVMEYRIVRPDGCLRHLRVSIEVVSNTQGKPVGVRGTHLDMTALAVARQEAEEANALFESILDATPDFTIVTNLETGGLVYGSVRSSILGASAEQLQELGADAMTSLVHPAERSRLQAMSQDARNIADGVVLHLNYRAKHPDGCWHWLNHRVTPFRRDEATGQVVEVLGVVRDVTDEYSTELALRHSEARLRALITQVVDYAVIPLDADGLIESWNPGAERLKGYTATQAIGKHFSMFYSEDDRAAELPRRMLKTARLRGRVQQEGWRICRDGSRFWGDVAITALRDENGTLTGYVKVIRDLTNRLAEAQFSLLATVSHDLRNPIAAIKMYAELLPEVDDATQATFASRIEVRARHLAMMVDGLADYAKLRKQAVSLCIEPLCLSELASSLIDSLGPVLIDHPVDVEANCSLAMADHSAVTRILENLLSNAAKYSPDGAPITITFDESDDHVLRLRVTDEGRGIAPADLDSVFAEFNRGQLAEDDGGTGLGLASVRQLATLQGGCVWIESQLGAGTSVTVELPRGDQPPAA